MAGEIGYSFSPGQARDAQVGQPNGPGAGMSPQEAVRILSLRIPDRASPSAVAPLPLLTSKGSAGPGGADLDVLLAALMRAFKPPLGPGGQPTLPSGGSQFGRGESPRMPTFQPSPGPSLPPLSVLPASMTPDRPRSLFDDGPQEEISGDRALPHGDPRTIHRPTPRIIFGDNPLDGLR